MADVTVNNPLGDDENFDDDKGKGGGGSSTPVRTTHTRTIFGFWQSPSLSRGKLRRC